ncbi:MAG TPA: hypothetical protein PK095_16690, partial [Myxococcota bacterium]|nr:hypothetical protein [Myxococcota bacterium]
MSPTKRTTRALLTTLLLLSSAPALAKPVPRIWDVSPLAQMMRADMAQAGRTGLEQLVTTLGTRLILTTESVGIDQLGDIELLWRLATGVQMLTEVSEPSADLFKVERATAFAVFTIGHRYQTRDDFRFALDGLEADTSGQGPLLLASVRQMKDYGATWFRAARERLSKLGPLDIETEHQYGRILLDTGLPQEGAKVLSETFAKGPDRELARSMCDAMVAVGEPALVTRLSAMKERMQTDGLVALAEEIDFCLIRHADEKATRAFEQRIQAGTVQRGEVVAQIDRLVRLDRAGAAEQLARGAMQLEPEIGFVAAAELYFRLERWQSLASLFADAKARGISNERLSQLEALALVAMHVRQALGHAVSPNGDPLAALEASTLSPLVKRAQIAMLSTARFMGSAKEQRGAVVAEVDRAIAELLKHHGAEPTGLGAVLISMLATDRLDAGLKLIAPKMAALERAARKKGAPQAQLVAFAELASLVGRVELGMGFRERDPRRIGRALGAMKKVGPAERSALGVMRAAELQLAEVTGALAIEALSGEVKSFALVEALHEWALPRTSTNGRNALQARAMLLGTLAALKGEDGVAVSRWLEARTVLTGPVAFLAGGLVQLVIGDVHGASTLCSRAEQ